MCSLSCTPEIEPFLIRWYYLCLTRANTPKRGSDGASASLRRLARRQPAFASTPCSSTVRTAFGSFGVFGAVFCFVISTFSFAGPKNHVFPCQAKVIILDNTYIVASRLKTLSFNYVSVLLHFPFTHPDINCV